MLAKLIKQNPTLSRANLRSQLVFFLCPLLAFAAMSTVDTGTTEAQRTRFNDFFQVVPGNAQGGIVAPPQGGFVPGGVIPQGGVIPGGVIPGGVIPGGVIPQGGIIQTQPGAIFGGNILPSTQPPITALPPSGVLQVPNNGSFVAPQPSFDPFRTPNNPFPSFPQPAPLNAPRQLYPAPNSQPIFGSQPNFQPNRQSIFGRLPNPQPSVFSQPQINPPQLPQINRPQLPQFNPGSGDFSLANRWPNANTAWPSQSWARLRNDVLPRLLERPRFRHTWLQGGDNSELDINDTEIATTVTFANWLGGRQPFRLSPGFIFHFWDGPNTPETGFDLPAQAYSFYLAGDYSSDPRATAGYETNLTIGYYSDFDNTSSDAIRLTGSGLLWKRINSYTTFKLGAEYINRVDIKLLPAIGVFLEPNPDLRLDVYFPRPKLAQRLPRFGRYEVWSYIGAEYGGGSWAIERTPLEGPNFDDQADINDVRAFLGLEWMGPRRVTGFLELGYAFEREIVYASDQDNPFEVNDTFMLRTGLAF